MHQYNGDLLRVSIDRTAREAVEQALTRHNTKARLVALTEATSPGQQFKVTGGHHLTSSDFLWLKKKGS